MLSEEEEEEELEGRPRFPKHAALSAAERTAKNRRLKLRQKAKKASLWQSQQQQQQQQQQQNQAASTHSRTSKRGGIQKPSQQGSHGQGGSKEPNRTVRGGRVSHHIPQPAQIEDVLCRSCGRGTQDLIEELGYNRETVNTRLGWCFNCRRLRNATLPQVAPTAVQHSLLLTVDMPPTLLLSSAIRQAQILPWVIPQTPRLFMVTCQPTPVLVTTRTFQRHSQVLLLATCHSMPTPSWPTCRPQTLTVSIPILLTRCSIRAIHTSTVSPVTTGTGMGLNGLGDNVEMGSSKNPMRQQALISRHGIRRTATRTLGLNYIRQIMRLLSFVGLL